jgi:hypothetical protein
MSRIEEIRQRNEAEKKLLAGKFPEEKRHVSDIEYLLAQLDRIKMHGEHECPACGWDHTEKSGGTISAEQSKRLLDWLHWRTL